MKKIKLDIEINASPEKVWDSIVNDGKYRQWTTPFAEGSFFEGGWNKGDTIYFLIIKDGKKEGMVAEIAESIYPEFISIRHLGFFQNGIEDTTSDDVKAWNNIFENYTLRKLGPDKTLFVVEADSTDEYYEMFMEMWPNALKKLKEISEMDSILDAGLGI